MLFTVSQNWLFFRFTFNSSKFAYSAPQFQRRRGLGLLPPHFVATLHETVLCSVPKNYMTPNDIRAYQTTSFVWINQWKL